MSILQAKRQFVVETATQLFLERGIATVTIHDIAAALGMGEATIYRYFGKKQHLIVAAAMQLENEEFAGYFNLDAAQRGGDKIALFYRGFVRVFEAHPEFFTFLSQFDACIDAENDLAEYEKALAPFFDAFADAYRLGLQDGSVRPVQNLALFYLTTTHALLGLCKKMAVEGKLLAQDIYGVEEIELLINIYLQHICA